MPVTVAVEGRSVVHAGSGGVVMGPCNVCLMQVPPPVSMIPMLFPSISKSADASSVSKHVTCDGNGVCLVDSCFKASTGDKAGKKGVASGTVSDKTEFGNASLNVKFEGKAVVRALDPASYNSKNGALAPVQQPPIVAPPAKPDNCPICDKPLA